MSYITKRALCLSYVIKLDRNTVHVFYFLNINALFRAFFTWFRNANEIRQNIKMFWASGKANFELDDNWNLKFKEVNFDILDQELLEK